MQTGDVFGRGIVGSIDKRFACRVDSGVEIDLSPILIIPAGGNGVVVEEVMFDEETGLSIKDGRHVDELVD